MLKFYVDEVAEVEVPENLAHDVRLALDLDLDAGQVDPALIRAPVKRYDHDPFGPLDLLYEALTAVDWVARVAAARGQRVSVS